MFNLEEERKECALGNKDLVLSGQERGVCYVFIYDVGIRGIYSSLTLGTAKFKTRD